MFKILPYKSKLKICELFYNDFYNITNKSIKEMLPDNIYFSWSIIIFETKSGDKIINRDTVSEWYDKNLKIIRREKLLNIKNVVVFGT